MRRTKLNEGWSFRPKANLFSEGPGGGSEPLPVTLPHDAMIEGQRWPEGTPAAAYFPGGAWEYSRSLDPIDPGQCVSLEFEGVYRDALVYVNDNLAAHRPNGYAEFAVSIDHLLRPGVSNQIRVEVRAHDDSRWYSGAGLYRNVWLLEASRLHIQPGGIAVSAQHLDDEVATIEVVTVVENHDLGLAQPTLQIEIVDASGATLAQSDAPVSLFPGDVLPVRQTLVLESPNRWRLDNPYLYECRVTLRDQQVQLDTDRATFGLRSLSADRVHGLRINEEKVLLRGACVHHDNGPLGAATIDRAEERRIELLKEAGFNAVRSAHNPMSRAMLAACDRHGILVMDETFDMWEQPKSNHDYALRFADWWEADVEAMVKKDRNHPCVILYSIGNEIPEAGSAHGARQGRAVAERVRELDPHRLVTEAVTGLLIGGDEVFQEMREQVAEQGERAGKIEVEPATEMGVNTAHTQLADILNDLVRSPVVTRKSAETFSYLDVAGYNYMDSRFEMDGKLFPHRVIVGSETYAGSIDRAWALVKRHPYVVGDFTWTGWDYLGEVGIGRTTYTPAGSGTLTPNTFHGEFPWRAAWCGDLDICGTRRPQSYYREIVFGLRTDPYIAVMRPGHHGDLAGFTPWSWTDSVSSWSWGEFGGKPVTVEVYADADEVELVLNRRSLGRRPAGRQHRFRAEFETTYEAGLLEAVAWSQGREVGRTSLHSAVGPVQLSAIADRTEISAEPSDLAFVDVSLIDSEGALCGDADRDVAVEVEGPGTLQALGSANPATEEGFAGPTCRTFDGRALAIVRPTGPGQISVTVTAEGCAPVRLDLKAQD